MKFRSIILILIVCVSFSSCTNIKSNEDNKEFSELLRTGEFYTTDEMEALKTQALSWQSASAGIGSFGYIVVIEPSDGSEQQVFISVDCKAAYEKIQIQPPKGASARILSAWSGAGSGELMIAYKFISKDSEWVELFYAYSGNLIENHSAQWENVTDVSHESEQELIQTLNELPPEERQFK